METLSNFSSIYCFITFIMGAVFMFIAVCVVAMGKEKEPRNKVRFFVTKDSYAYTRPILWLERPKRMEFTWFTDKISVPIAVDKQGFEYYGLNIKDYEYLKWEDEPVEVFLNLED